MTQSSPSTPDLPGSAERSARLYEAVARATAAVTCQHDVAGLVDAMLEQTRLLGATVITVFAADPERRELTLLGQLGVPPEIANRIARLPFDAPLVAARAAATLEPQIVEGLEALAPGLNVAGEIMTRTGASNVFSFPLISAGKLVGVLTGAHPRAPSFSRDEEEAVLALMSVFASSLGAARAHEQDRLQLESLRLATLAIAAPLSLTAVLQNIVDHARTLAGADYAALGIVDTKTPEGPFNPWVFSGMTEHDHALIGRTPRPVGLLGAVAAEARVIRLKDVADDERFRGLPMNHPSMKSFIGVPVSYRERVVGNLYLANKRDAEEFSDVDQRIVEMLAQHAGVAIERARTYDELLGEVARHQRDLEALRASEERFRRLADMAPDMICRHRIDASRAVEYVSPSVKSILGHAPEDYYRDPGLLFRQVHPFDRPILGAALRARDPLLGPLTLRWLHPNGSIVWVESRFVPVRDEAGEITEVESVSRDVTARKQAEGEIERLMERLGAQRAWLQVVIESSPVGIVLIEDTLGNRVIANRAAESLFGRPILPEGGIEQYREQLRDARGAPLSREDMLVTKALRGEAVSGEEQCIQSGARDVPVLVSAAPLRDERGRVSGAIVVFRDISALKELERLRHEWTSIVAHDLRQPVGMIMLQAGLLAREAPDPSCMAKIDHIRRSADRLKRMISDLLDASRIDAGQLPLRLEAVDIVALARAVVERMGGELENRARVEAVGDVPKVQADALRFEEILVNLLSNAQKYSYEGTPIVVAIEAKPAGVVVSVENQGEGVSREELRTLFERFRRTERAKKSPVQGVGLGLYIARGLVEAHGGHIWAESAPGGTTRFSFVFPIQRAAEAA